MSETTKTNEAQSNDTANKAGHFDDVVVSTQSKCIDRMTRKEFEALPCRKWDEDIGEFDTLVILPTRHIHDSGYRCMDFIACVGSKAIIRLSGCSDVIHLDGIGGYGKWSGAIPESIKIKGWSIDCLRTSGLLRLFSSYRLTVGSALSSFAVHTGRKY